MWSASSPVVFIFRLIIWSNLNLARLTFRNETHPPVKEKENANVLTVRPFHFLITPNGKFVLQPLLKRNMCRTCSGSPSNVLASLHSNMMYFILQVTVRPRPAACSLWLYTTIPCCLLTRIHLRNDCDHVHFELWPCFDRSLTTQTGVTGIYNIFRIYFLHYSHLLSRL